MDYYAILGVDPTASPEVIREAYHHLARALHPDRSGADTAEKFLRIQEAWETLGDSDRRRAYDARRRPAPPRRSPPRHESSGMPLHLALHVTPSEARAGGQVAVDLPASSPCPACGGRHGPCRTCGGRGNVVQTRRLVLDIPGGLRRGETLQVHLPDDGFVYPGLVLHVEVDW